MKTFKGGLPFEYLLSEDLEAQKERIKGNFASMIIIDGAIGQGKTTLAVHIADYLTGSKINFKNQLGMGGEQFQEKLQICHDNKLIVCIYDEAGDFDRRGSLTKFNRQINRVFDTYRAYKIIVILILPCFNVLDNSLFDKQIPRLLLNCYGRTQKYGSFRAYSLYRMYYLRTKLSKMTVKPQAYSSTSPNYHGRFYDLTPERSSELTLLSTATKKDILTSNVLANRGLKNKKDLAKELHISMDWLNKKLHLIKAKPVQKYNRQNYYSTDVLNKLENIKVYGGYK